MPIASMSCPEMSSKPLARVNSNTPLIEIVPRAPTCREWLTSTTPSSAARAKVVAGLKRRSLLPGAVSFVGVGIGVRVEMQQGQVGGGVYPAREAGAGSPRRRRRK